MAVSDKLQSILDSKAAIKAAIEAKGVADVGDILANYPDKIASIPSGGSGSASGWTGHVDAEGLRAIGWDDEDIAHYQAHGVNWNEEDDAYHKVPQDNIDLYGVLTIDNIQLYKDRIVYLPKIDTSGVTNMSYKFQNCYSMVAIPLLNTSSVRDMSYMFNYCYSLVSIPQLDTSRVENMNNMFSSCYSLIYVPLLDVRNATNISYMFNYCSSLISIPQLELHPSSAENAQSIIENCYSLANVHINAVNLDNIFLLTFNRCFSLANLRISNLKCSIAIDFSLLVTKESLLYMIQNAQPTSDIIIGVNEYTYNKYNQDADILAALELQPNVSLASA